MSTGVEYAFSGEKRAFDLAVATAMTPFAFGSRLLLGHALREYPGEDSNPIFLQERGGIDGEPFIIHKFRTLDSATRRKPLGRTAQIFRQYGLDELSQALNIFKGEMSVGGYRPIPLDEEEEMFDSANSGKLVDAWKQVVRPTKPGILSTFSVRNHRHPDKTPNMIRLAPLKFVLDIDDVFRGSLETDIGLMAAAFKTLIIDRTPQEDAAAAEAATNPPS